MSAVRKTFDELVRAAGIGNLPEGVGTFYEAYEDDGKPVLINREFLDSAFARFAVPEKEQLQLLEALAAVEGDEDLFAISKFIVQDMCSARNRRDFDSYTAMKPASLKEHGESYSFLILLACVEPSMKMLEARGVPKEHYENIPYQPMERQFRKLVEKQDPAVSDFPWDMNFYTCAIFLLDRFFFIPYKFEDDFDLVRDRNSGRVIALRQAGEVIRSDGQYDGINNVYDEAGRFETVREETGETIRANIGRPMGFVEREPQVFRKADLQFVLKAGDDLLAVHIPSGPGYTPERLKHSMELALDFYDRYFPEIEIKGFWSESWLYDPRLSLVLPEESNIIRVQRQLFIYPIEEGDEMLRYEIFGDRKADPETAELKTSLQRAARDYMRRGGRFNTTSMIVLRDDVHKMPNRPYISDEDIAAFRRVVDSHLHVKNEG